MHTITKHKFSSDMFTSWVDLGCIDWLEVQRGFFLSAKTEDAKKLYWRSIIENLPSGFIQKRTVMMSYAALRQICKQRKGHRLSEWEDFRDWAFKLPESWMIKEREGKD